MLKEENIYAGIDMSGSRRITDAVCAIIRRADDNKILVQRRDDRANVPFRNLRGFFGGSIENSETDEEALIRELNEELRIEIKPGHAKYICRFDLDLSPVLLRKCYRVYFDLAIPRSSLNLAVLGEGQAMEYLSEAEALKPGFLVPYDSYVLWLIRNAGQFYV